MMLECLISIAGIIAYIAKDNHYTYKAKRDYRLKLKRDSKKALKGVKG